MNVGFMSSSIWTEFGSSELLHSFFSTICYHLEAGKRGNNYPYMLNKFYYEKLDPEDIECALNEIKDIRTKLKNLSSENIIWDVNDISKNPPESFLSTIKEKNLSECFISKGGRNIFDLLLEQFEFCNRKKFSIKIKSEFELTKDIFS